MAQQQKSPRISTVIERSTDTAFDELAEATGVTKSRLAASFLTAQVPKINEYLVWLETKPKGSPEHEKGRQLADAISYQSLRDGMRALDPDYLTPSEKGQQRIERAGLMALLGKENPDMSYAQLEVEADRRQLQQRMASLDAKLRALEAQDAVLTLDFDIDDALLNSLKGEA